jgi:hypothetical protein
MKNPFNEAPRCVQWAAVILFSLPIYDAVVALRVLSASVYFSQWSQRAIPVALLWAFAVGLLWGINIVRIAFLANLIFAAFTTLVTISSYGYLNFGALYSLTWQIAPVIALVLCFLPAANRYFTRKSGSSLAAPVSSASPDVPEPVSPSASLQTADLDSREAPRRRGPSRTVLVVLPLAVVATVLLLWGFVFPAFQNARQITDARDEAYHRAIDESQVTNNLRQLSTAANQYFLEHNGSTAHLSDLVGPNRYFRTLGPASGVKYPEVYSPSTPLIAVLPDGSRMSYDPDTGKTQRIPRPAGAHRP